jgi:hypothetical protein
LNKRNKGRPGMDEKDIDPFMREEPTAEEIKVNFDI